MKTMNGQSVVRRRAGGAAMVETILILPILVFLAALALFFTAGMSKKGDTQIVVRHELWRQCQGGWWGDSQQNWPDWNGDATGPIGSGGAVSGDRPRGNGEEFDYLYGQIGSQVENASIDQSATDYLRRIWNNWPGRHHRAMSTGYSTGSQAFRYFDGTITTDYYNDSPTWVHGQEPGWLLAQYGPMAGIKSRFEAGLVGLPLEFLHMRDELTHAWFEEDSLLNWNNANAPVPKP